MPIPCNEAMVSPTKRAIDKQQGIAGSSGKLLPLPPSHVRVERSASLLSARPSGSSSSSSPYTFGRHWHFFDNRAGDQTLYFLRGNVWVGIYLDSNGWFNLSRTGSLDMETVWSSSHDSIDIRTDSRPPDNIRGVTASLSPMTGAGRPVTEGDIIGQWQVSGVDSENFGLRNTADGRTVRFHPTSLEF